jgi:uncharacterized membrane-anchored protein
VVHEAWRGACLAGDGDFTAFTLNLGYFASALLFAVAIAVPAGGYRGLGWNPVVSFWAAYVATRPLGASIADGLGKARSDHGLGLGQGRVVLAIGVLIAVLVAYVAARDRNGDPLGLSDTDRPTR